MTSAPGVLFSISGHGFGHAVRQTAIINALLARAPVRVLVRSSVPARLLDRTIEGPYQLLPAETDTGVTQIDGLRLDARATIRRAAAFYADLAARARVEAALLRTHGVDLVVADAPPLACAAAALAGVTGVICANFTWDWIYEEYLDQGLEAPGLLDTIRQAYAQAAGAWRLPMHGGFAGVHAVADVPLVARHARRGLSRADRRRMLRLPSGPRLALATFGGYGAADLPLERLDCGPDWHVVLTTPEATAPPAPAGVVMLPEAAIYAAGLRYQDLVAAVDAVVTKPGYGIIADCAASDTAMLYTSRGRFREYDVLVRALPAFVRAQFLDPDALRQGRWRTALEALGAAAPLASPPRTDGAEVVADLIVRSAGLT